MRIRIWHQSCWDLTMLPTYRRALEAHARVKADEEKEPLGGRATSWGE